MDANIQWETNGFDNTAISAVNFTEKMLKQMNVTPIVIFLLF